MCEVDGAHGNELILPTGRSQLIFGLDPLHPVAVVQGPTTTATIIDAKPQRLALGVVLRPGGLRALTGESASSFTDRHIELGELIGIDAVGLIEELRDALSKRQVLLTLDRVISNKIAAVGGPPSERVHRAARLLRRGLGVGETCEQLNVSRTALVRSFRSEIGMGPKLYSRILRFESAVAKVRTAGSDGLASIAAEAGYADQAHMTREFAAFAGLTPSALHNDASAAPNHVTI